MNVKEELKEKGYCVIPNILSFENIRELKEEFNNWKNTIPNYERLHKEIDPPIEYEIKIIYVAKKPK